jgi:hypothetical protein
MRYVIAILLSATLLIHALVGCSQHCDADCASCKVATPERSPATGCCHHCGTEESRTDHMPCAPCKCKLECQQYCVSLPPEKVSVGDSTTALPLAIVPIAVDSDSLLTAENALGSLINIPPPREASERLHLALQVLLI